MISLMRHFLIGFVIGFVGTALFYMAGCGTVHAAWGPNGCATVVAQEPISAPHAKSAKCKCDPCNCKAPCKCGQAQVFFGVDRTMLKRDGKNHYHVNGREVQKHEAIAALTLTDDSAKPFITFIGDGRDALVKAFLATPEASRCRVNAYDAGDWHVTGGFVTTGKPTVYVQSPKGAVLYRGDNPTLEVVQREARKAQPDYDPSKDPSGVVPTTDYVAIVTNYAKEHSGFLFFVGMVGVVLLIIKKG